MHALACNRVTCSADHCTLKFPGLQFSIMAFAMPPNEEITTAIIVACGPVIEVHHPHHPPTHIRSKYNTIIIMQVQY